MISSPERRSKLVRMLAETYVKTDDPKTAIAILEGFLRNFPGEMGATSMLNGLRRQVGD
jgi:outer membrane protein assembly factor BamD (BamD/ComL family)